MPVARTTSSPNTASRPRIALVSEGSRAEIRGQVAQLKPQFEKACEIVEVDFDFAAEFADLDVDFVAVLGGDGSILRAARQMGYRQRPVLGVNLGKLGFLADVSPNGLVDALDRIAAGRYRIVDHLMFECTLLRDGQVLREELGLNEVAVLAGPPFTLIEVQLYVDAEVATTYSCDGLIVSTPVGSTAHSLSAGGPILQKSLQAFVISPISPHTLTNRPVVDAADRVYELAVPKPHEGTSLVVDGRMLGHLDPSDRIRIEKSKAVFQLVEVEGHGYYRTLREKLGWGGRLRSCD
jgi:NAD+ kinase